MKNLEDKVTQLCEIITSTDKKTSIKLGEFDGYYRYEEIEETTYFPSYSATRRFMAKRKLKRIYENTEDSVIKLKCETGFSAENARYVGRELVGELAGFAMILLALGFVAYNSISFK